MIRNFLPLASRGHHKNLTNRVLRYDSKILQYSKVKNAKRGITVCYI